MFMKILKELNLRNIFRNNRIGWSHYMHEAYVESELLKKQDQTEYTRNCRYEIMCFYRNVAVQYIGFADYEHYIRYLRRHGCIKVGKDQIGLGKWRP